MPAETVSEQLKASSEPHYTRRSFELVFTSFCNQYAQRVGSLSGSSYPGDEGEGFMGLPINASWLQMTHRLKEVGQVMGNTPKWDDNQEDVSARDAVLLPARYLAWHATMGGITQQYLDKLEVTVKRQKRDQSRNGGNRHNLNRLYREQNAAEATLLAQNHALRDHFDSGLARAFGYDAPESMDRLLSHVPYLHREHRESLVRGISLEIATKRYLEKLVEAGELGDAKVAYGNDEQDSRGGDLVLLAILSRGS